MISIRLRPNRSVRVPDKSEPKNMPMTAAEASNPTLAGLRPRLGSASRDGTMAPNTTTSKPSAITVAQQTKRTMVVSLRGIAEAMVG
jgi:hypothetical protein